MENPLFSILIGLAMLAVVVPIVADPLRHAAAQRPRDRRPADRQGSYPAALRALRDLDFDHQTGKLSDADHVMLRAELLREAAQAMPTPAAQADLEARLEEEVRRVRLERRGETGERCQSCGEKLRREDRFCPRCGQAAAQTCGRCGAPAGEIDRYCVRCGHPLGMEAR